MKKIFIYQIFYNEETRLKLDPGFIPLSNIDNLRPDWYEYWPIRRLFSSEFFEEETWVGVFSPKFFEKTGMTSAEVIDAVQISDGDLVSFSPWFAHIALYWNIFHQIEHHHPGAMRMIKKLMDEMRLDYRLLDLPMSARQTIFCNYFVAPVKIWRKWLFWLEFIYQAAESRDGYFGRELTYGSRNSGYNGVPMKIFIAEGLISLIVLSKGLSVDYAACMSKMLLGMNFNNSEKSREVLLLLDEIKSNYRIDSMDIAAAEHRAMVSEILSLRDVMNMM